MAGRWAAAMGLRRGWGDGVAGSTDQQANAPNQPARATLLRVQVTPLSAPSQVRHHAERHFGPGRLRLATAGYSTSLDREHPARVASLLAALVERLGAERLGFVTSPTTTGGSIDRVTTLAGIEANVPVLHVTAAEFARAGRADGLPQGKVRRAWGEIPKFTLPTREAYSEATAHASDALLVVGGRNATVADFSNAMRLGRPAVVLIDALLRAPPWGAEERRPTNAARYLADLIGAWRAGRPPPHPEPAPVAPADRAGWAEGWPERLLCVELAGPEAVGPVAGQIAAFLGAHTLR